MRTKVLILGSGCAGHTAAIYAARADLEPIVLSGSQVGGQLVFTSMVENFPGFPQGVVGFDLIDNMRQQAEKFGAVYFSEQALKVDLSQRPFHVFTDANKEYITDSLIIATGAKAKTLGLDNETKYFGSGISTCATCDAAFFRNKKVAVVGGGDTALEDALFLTRFATEIHIFHRRDQFRASKILQTRALEHPKIKVHWNSEIIEIIGKERLESIRCISHPKGKPSQRLEDPETKQEILEYDGLFLAIGHTPNTAFLENQLPLDENGYLVPEKTDIPTCDVNTKIPGVFIAGDVVDPHFQQAITASAMGCKAAIQAAEFLANVTN